MYALMCYKPWKFNPLELWSDRAPEATSPEDILETKPHVFDEAWKEFVETDTRGREYAERVRSFLDERSCTHSRTSLGASVDGNWSDDPMWAGLFGAAQARRES